MRQKQTKTGGFTIIEVMIVLAIAGLIMLIVFLAVPALQRTSRNTQRVNDAAGALAAVNTYITNNGGSLPTAAGTSFAAPVLTVSGGAGTASSTTNLGYYTTAASVTLAAAPPASLPAAATDTLTLYENAYCPTATSIGTGNGRQIAAVYGIETGNGTYAWQCKQS